MQLAAKLANDLSQLGSVLLDHAPCFLQPGELGLLNWLRFGGRGHGRWFGRAGNDR